MKPDVPQKAEKLEPTEGEMSERELRQFEAALPYLFRHFPEFFRGLDPRYPEHAVMLRFLEKNRHQISDAILDDPEKGDRR